MFLARLVSALDQGKVPYAIVGGYAVALHGAVRGTVDIDLVLRFTKKDFQAAAEAFLSLGLVSKLPLEAGEVFDFREEYIEKRNLIAWSFYNPSVPSEVVDVVITHDLRVMKTLSIRAGKLIIKILAIDDLIRMKESSGRPQDLEDVRALKRLR